MTPTAAASAAIVAAFLTWLGGRINDRTNAKREKSERWDTFIVEEAAKFQRAGEVCHRFRLNGKSPDEAEGLLAEVTAGYNQLLIVAPKEVAIEVMNTYQLVIQHSGWDYDEHQIMPDHYKRRTQLSESIRKAIGIRAYDWNPPTLQDMLEMGNASRESRDVLLQ